MVTFRLKHFLELTLRDIEELDTMPDEYCPVVWDFMLVDTAAGLLFKLRQTHAELN